MKRIFKQLIGLVFVIGAVITLSACKSNDTITIVHKNYTEQRLLGEMLSVYLEDQGYETKVSELGGTMLCFNAIKSGEADLHVEYTGTLYGAILEQEEILSAQDTYDYVKKESEEQHGITLLGELGYNNTYVLSVTKETAEKYNLKSVSDLIPYSKDLVLGCDLEFSNRVDGLPGLMETYKGLSFKDVKSMDQGLTYQALDSGDIDVNVSYSTDGRIVKFNLLNLEDDKNFFPPYYATPIAKKEFVSENPEVVKALEALYGLWTDEDMQKYNFLVDEGENARDVATTMLKDKGLID